MVTKGPLIPFLLEKVWYVVKLLWISLNTYKYLVK